MQSPDKLKKHADLVDRMASARGIDLEEQMMRGRLSFGALEDAVLRCSGCTSPDDCAHWLAERRTADSTPEYCRNGKLFQALAEEADDG